MRIEHLRGEPLTLFLDDGGVLNDNRLRRPEWVRLIGEYMPLRLGGGAEAWRAANHGVFQEVWGRLQPRMPDFGSFRGFQEAYATSWVIEMCARVGVAAPPLPEAMALYTELSVYVSERAVSAFPGAAEAVRRLHRAGYRLHMASGTPSWELAGILGRMGVAELFSGMYGPDLVDQVKYGPAYYEKVFADADVEPSRALVVESDLECCRWAVEAGARAVWIDTDRRGDMPTLAEFVQALIEGDE